MVREVAPHFSYPGTVEIIREAIRRLAPEEKWVSPYGDCVEICECKWLPDGNPSSGFGDWALRLKSMDPKDRGRCAAIHARLAPEGQRTNVMYRDGRDLAWFLKEPKLVGEVFEDFLWAVFREVHWIVGRCTAQAEGQVTTPDGGGGSKPSGGRPPNAENDWAYQEIEAGRNQTEVYKEWLEKIPDSRRSQMVDPLDSFKKAMRYRKKRGKKGIIPIFSPPSLVY